MAKRRRISGNGMRHSGNVIHVSSRLRWELALVRTLGLEDVDWDPELCCPHCRAERAARGEPVEDLTPPSGTRPKLLLDDEDATPTRRARPTCSKGGGTSRPLKLVRPPWGEHEKRSGDDGR
jgi:hypothetical protein